MVLSPTQSGAATVATSGALTMKAPNVGAVLDRIRRSARETPKPGGLDLVFEAMGTVCRVSVGGTPTVLQTLPGQVLQWVASFEAKYSRFLTDSWISQINQAAGSHWVAVDAEVEKLFALCDQMVFLTRGVFDPTALPLIRLWNWKATPPQVPQDAQIETARQCVGWKKVQRAPGKVFLPQPGMCLDLGGMGKEFAVDQVALLCRARGATGVLVDFGADIRVSGPPPDGRPAWHIGLDDPKKPGKPWCGLGVADAAVATSGDYLRKFEINGRRFGHIVDVRTGRPVDNGCRGVSVLAPNCTLAGMLSTATFVLGPEEGLRLIEAQMGAAGAIVLESKTVTSRRFYEYVIS